jgi:hypothetical protein
MDVVGLSSGFLPSLAPDPGLFEAFGPLGSEDALLRLC